MHKVSWSSGKTLGIVLLHNLRGRGSNPLGTIEYALNTPKPAPFTVRGFNSGVFHAYSTLFFALINRTVACHLGQMDFLCPFTLDSGIGLADVAVWYLPTSCVDRY